jgi:hypothetical protein
VELAAPAERRHVARLVNRRIARESESLANRSATVGIGGRDRAAIARPPDLRSQPPCAGASRRRAARHAAPAHGRRDSRDREDRSPRARTSGSAGAGPIRDDGRAGRGGHDERPSARRATRCALTRHELDHVDAWLLQVEALRRAVGGGQRSSPPGVRRYAPKPLDCARPSLTVHSLFLG